MAAAHPPPAAHPSAAAPVVSAALTQTNVRVNSDFRGDQIVLYGAVFDPASRPSDVVVIVRGPDQPVRIARKNRIAGLWINSRPVVFQGAPGFYIAASTRPLDEIARFGVLRRLEAGVDHLAINAPAEQRTETRYGVRDVVVSRLGADYLDWRRAVVTSTSTGFASSTRACSAPRSRSRPRRRSASTMCASCSSRTASRCRRRTGC
jgi:uncharacterized protein (TIGR02186 family)